MNVGFGERVRNIVEVVGLRVIPQALFEFHHSLLYIRNFEIRLAQSNVDQVRKLRWSLKGFFQKSNRVRGPASVTIERAQTAEDRGIAGICFQSLFKLGDSVGRVPK